MSALPYILAVAVWFATWGLLLLGAYRRGYRRGLVIGYDHGVIDGRRHDRAAAPAARSRGAS